MNRSRLALLLAVAAVLVTIGLKCGGPPTVPVITFAPESTWVNAPTEIRVYATSPGKKDIRYITDLGNSTADTSDVWSSGDTAQVFPKWTATGDFTYKIMAFLDADPTKTSEYSAPKTIKVLPNNYPESLLVEAPPVAVKNVSALFQFRAVDPEGDSIQFYVNWGDGSKGWLAGWVASGAWAEGSHTFTNLGTFWVKFKARDKKKSESPFDSVQVEVGTAGAVIAWVQPGDDEGEPLPVGTSPALVIAGDTLIYSGGCDDGYFYSITYGKFKKEKRGSAVAAENVFTGHPAYCAQTGHIIAGNEDGELYAFNTALGTSDWHYPGKTREDSLTWIEWGTPAINGNKIYIPREKLAARGEDDKLYALQDNGSSVSLIGSYRFPMSISTPVVDGAGNVYVGSDSGVLYCLPPSINSVTWSKQLQVGELRGLCLDDVGTLYLTSEFGNVYAINKDNGEIIWDVTPDPGREPHKIVIAPGALFLTTSSGRLYKLNPTTGATIWQKQVSPSDMPACPVLGGTEVIYCLDDDDILYCVKQSDGTVMWWCNCPQQAGHGRRTRSTRLTSEYGAALTIAPDGNIIVVGEEAMYKVAGYPEHLLPTTAPWPKWQKDQYNTGKK
uniref:Pyrrolo-quinoline quinone repeat domain-containing protein n=1 Tax=candidate division WOR-3 bacterium TaxID=2052148 RepID=A0A7C4CA55_UNCW3